MTTPARIGNVLHPVAHVAAAVDFSVTAFGLPTTFVDGDRYAARDGNGTTPALAAPEEDITGGVRTDGQGASTVGGDLRGDGTGSLTIDAPAVRGLRGPLVLSRLLPCPDRLQLAITRER